MPVVGVTAGGAQVARVRLQQVPRLARADRPRLQGEGQRSRRERRGGGRPGEDDRLAAGRGAQDVDARRGQVHEAAALRVEVERLRGVHGGDGQHRVVRGRKGRLGVRTVAGRGDDERGTADGRVDHAAHQRVAFAGHAQVHDARPARDSGIEASRQP